MPWLILHVQPRLLAVELLRRNLTDPPTNLLPLPHTLIHLERHRWPTLSARGLHRIPTLTLAQLLHAQAHPRLLLRSGLLDIP
jgi:hypothetical protein